MSFVRSLKQSLGEDGRLLDRFLVRSVAYGVLQGLALACLVPLADALVDSDLQRAGWWVAALAVLTGVSVVPHYLQAMAAFDVALSVLRRLQHRIGDHVVALPMGWFHGGRASEVSLAATKSTLGIGNTAAHSLGHVVIGWTSATVIAVLAVVWDPRLGLVLLVGTALAWLLRRWSLRLGDNADKRVGERRDDLNRNLLEYARYQPALRSAGRSLDYHPLEDANSRHTRAHR